MILTNQINLILNSEPELPHVTSALKFLNAQDLLER